MKVLEISMRIFYCYSRKQPKSIEQIAPIDRLPVVGYMGHRAVFRQPRRQGKYFVYLVQAPPEPSEIKIPEK